MSMNTPYLNTAGSPAGVSNQSQIAGSQASFVNVEITSGLTVGGAVQFNSTVSLVGATSLGNVTVSNLTVSGVLASTGTANFASSRLLSRQTTASLTSATLRDGELSIGSVSVDSATIYFRSGVTTYQFAAILASVL